MSFHPRAIDPAHALRRSAARPTTLARLAGPLLWLGFAPAAAQAQACDVFERVPSPNVGSEANFLLGVAALGEDEAWAVGHYRSGTSTLPLSMRWNGSAWTVVSMPVPDTFSGLPSVALHDVHAFGSSDVWAVGSNQGPDSAAQETLAYRWNGSEWLVVPSAAGSAGAYGSEFYCVDGVSGDDFWAVGYLNDSGAPNASTLAAHWNGSSWEEHILPSLGNANIPALKDLHVRASDDIWALEGIGLGPPVSPRRVFHWDGSAWSEGTDRLDPLRYGAAEAIHAFGPDDVWVSSVLDSSFQVVMLHWDGSSWTEMNVPVFAYAFFGDAPDDFFAVGYASILHWDGSTWSVVETLPGLAQANCFDAELAPDGTLWCAGTTQPGPASQTLSARRTPCSPGLGDTYCTGAPNSVGPGARIHASGSASLAANDFELTVEGCPPSTPGLFFLGLAQVQLPFGEGFRCVGGTTRRIAPALVTDALGNAARQLDFTLPYGEIVTPGAPGVNYQFWYRDVAGGPAGFNLSDALNVEHAP